MIYVLAAYSITIGSLALYCVLLQHRGRVYAEGSGSGSRSTNPSTTPSSTPTSSTGWLGGGFNLGAALLSPLWMWQHGMRPPGIVLLILWAAMIPLYAREMWIPFTVVAMVPAAAGTALGFVGHRIAASHRGAESATEYSASQLPWAIGGVTLFSVILPWLWYFFGASQ